MTVLSPVVAGANPVVLYDGVCGLCNRMVQFILRRDPSGLFRFASLRGETAQRIFARHSIERRKFETAYVVLNVDQAAERLLQESEAVVFILEHLGACWRFVGRMLLFVPKRLRNWAYDLVARHRYRVFGRYDSCPLPSEHTRWRFLDG